MTHPAPTYYVLRPEDFTPRPRPARAAAASTEPGPTRAAVAPRAGRPRPSTTPLPPGDRRESSAFRRHGVRRPPRAEGRARGASRRPSRQRSFEQGQPSAPGASRQVRKQQAPGVGRGGDPATAARRSATPVQRKPPALLLTRRAGDGTGPSAPAQGPAPVQHGGPEGGAFPGRESTTLYRQRSSARGPCSRPGRLGRETEPGRGSLASSAPAALIEGASSGHRGTPFSIKRSQCARFSAFFAGTDRLVWRVGTRPCPLNN
jgi:hypothetical protein